MGIPDPKELGRFLRELREARGLSQGQLADRAETSAARISRLETGSGPVPRKAPLERLAEALELKQDEKDLLLWLAGHAGGTTSRDWSVINRLMNECERPVPVAQRPVREESTVTLTPLTKSHPIPSRGVLGHPQAADAATALLRIAAGTYKNAQGSPESARAEAEPGEVAPAAVGPPDSLRRLGISMVGSEHLISPTQRDRWEAAMRLVLQEGVPTVEIFEFRDEDSAIETVTRIVRRLAAGEFDTYQPRYFIGAPKRTVPYNIIVANWRAAALFFNTDDASSPPNGAYTFTIDGNGSTSGVTLLSNQFDRLCDSESELLLKIYRKRWRDVSDQEAFDAALGYEEELAWRDESESDRFQVKRGLSRLFVPHDLWMKQVRKLWGAQLFMDRESQEALFTYRERRQAALDAQLAKGKFFRFVTAKSQIDRMVRGEASRVDELLAGPGPEAVPLTKSMVKGTLQRVLSYLEPDRGPTRTCEIALLELAQEKQIPFFSWEVKAKEAAILESHRGGKGLMRIVLYHRGVVQALQDYFLDFWNGLPASATNKVRIVKYLEDKLKEADDLPDDPSD